MAALVVLSVSLTFWRTMVVKDFEIVDDVEFDVESDTDQL